MLVRAKAAGRLERKVTVIHGGLQKRARKEARTLTGLCERVREARAKRAAFRTLAEAEGRAGRQRVAAMAAAVEAAKATERALQMRYAQRIQ